METDWRFRRQPLKCLSSFTSVIQCICRLWIKGVEFLQENTWKALELCLIIGAGTLSQVIFEIKS